MFWLVVVAIVLVVSLVSRRALKRRRSPEFDQRSLENADYARLTQDITNFDRRYGDYGS